MATDNENTPQRHSKFGLVSCFLGGTMLVVQLSVLPTVILGITNPHGVIYALAIPFVMYCGGVAGADSPDANQPTKFDPPQMILDGSEIHQRLFPTFADFDGNGTTDLLVGIPKGRLLVYRNRGTDARPAYAEPAWLDETVPSARIPGG